MRKDLKVKYFPCCSLWQNLTELPFLETKRCLYGFYWVHQVCSFSALEITLSVKTRVGIGCAKNGSSAGCHHFLLSRREQENKSRNKAIRVGGNCLFVGHLLVFYQYLGIHL